MSQRITARRRRESEHLRWSHAGGDARQRPVGSGPCCPTGRPDVRQPSVAIATRRCNSSTTGGKQSRRPMIDRNMYIPIRSLPALVFVLSVVSIPADAQELLAADAAPVASVVAPLALSTEAVAAAIQDAAAPPSKAFEYSDALSHAREDPQVRQLRHAAAVRHRRILGQSLYDDPTTARRPPPGGRGRHWRAVRHQHGDRRVESGRGAQGSRGIGAAAGRTAC